MISPKLTPCAAPKGVSPDADGPADRLRRTNGRPARVGGACKASMPFGRPGGL